MKRFFALLLLTVVFSSCDDGDLTQVSFEFNNSPALACNSTVADKFFLFKTQDKRALIIKLPESNFPNRISADLTTPTQPLLIDANTVRFIYREYSGNVDSNTLCSAVPASNPMVVKEQEATEGIIRIVTTALKSEPDANGATQITGYLHTLTFSDLKFNLGDGLSQINETFTPVTYQTQPTVFTNFAGITGLNRCATDNSVFFKFLDKQALVLDLSPADVAVLFTNQEGVKKRLVSSENKLTRLFFNTTNTTLTNGYFCTVPVPETPQIIDSYSAVNGVEDVSGIIEVTSSPSDNGFKHKIVFKKVRFAKGSLNVELGNEFVFGEINIPNN